MSSIRNTPADFIEQLVAIWAAPASSGASHPMDLTPSLFKIEQIIQDTP